MLSDILYNSTEIAETIKSTAKKKSITVKDMLEELGMGFNSISHMRHGRMPSAESLAKIADYLGCSVDYLLGRTDETQVENAIELKPEEYPVIVKYRGTTEQGRETVDKLLDELYKNRNAPTAYSDERIKAILQNRPELTELANQIRMLNRDQALQAIDYISHLLAGQDKN